MISRALLNSFCIAFVGAVAIAFSDLATTSDYGTTGLIDIPTARFDADGTFAAAASTDERHKQFSIAYQATPWLQGTFRYTGFNDFFHWDRNYEFKARLWEEELYLPQVAVGIRDMVGTGVFGSEYIVGSKRFGSTDLTFGLGWGRLAGKGAFTNPLKELDDRFAVRDQFSGRGGELSLGQFFAGEGVGFFGGISHSFENLPVTAMVEYNPDQYDWDVRNGGSRPAEPWSAGIAWHAVPGVDLRLSLQHGDEVGIGFRSYFESKVEPTRRDPDVFISSYYLSPSDLPPQINKASWYDRLLYDVERSGLLLVEGTISADGNHAKLVVGNTSYSLWSDAIGRHTALADLHLPATVKSIHFVVEEGGHRSVTVVVPRPSSSFTDNPRTIIGQVQAQVQAQAQVQVPALARVVVLAQVPEQDRPPQRPPLH